MGLFHGGYPDPSVREEATLTGLPTNLRADDVCYWNRADRV